MIKDQQVPTQHVNCSYIFFAEVNWQRETLPIHLPIYTVVTCTKNLDGWVSTICDQMFDSRFNTTKIITVPASYQTFRGPKLTIKAFSFQLGFDFGNVRGVRSFIFMCGLAKNINSGAHLLLYLQLLVMSDAFGCIDFAFNLKVQCIGFKPTYWQ